MDFKTNQTSMLGVFAEQPTWATLFLLEAGMKAESSPVTATRWVQAILNYGELPYVTQTEIMDLTTLVVKVRFGLEFKFAQEAMTLLGSDNSARATYWIVEAMTELLLANLKHIVFDCRPNGASEAKDWLALSQQILGINGGKSSKELATTLGMMIDPQITKEFIGTLPTRQYKSSFVKALYTGINSLKDPETADSMLSALEKQLARLGVKPRDDGQPLDTAEIILQLDQLYAQAVTYGNRDEANRALLREISHVLASFTDEDHVRKIWSDSCRTGELPAGI